MAMTASWQLLHHGNWQHPGNEVPYISQLHHAKNVMCMLVGTWLSNDILYRMQWCPM